MPNKPQNTLNRRYRQTPYDQRPKRMTVFDFTRLMTQSERLSLFSNMKKAINRVFETHDEKYLRDHQAMPDHQPDQTWWEVLRSNHQ